MSQSSHVPKFGDWDGDNIPYTKFFEDARKDKMSGTKNFNPNDPEQNPEAFASGIFPAGYELEKPGRSPLRDAMHDTPSSVPKFGVWDEMDPTSRDGFTVIFNKVKQDKQNAANKLLKVPADTNMYPSKGENHAKSSSRSKIFSCCFRPKVEE